MGREESPTTGFGDVWTSAPLRLDALPSNQRNGLGECRNSRHGDSARERVGGAGKRKLGGGVARKFQGGPYQEAPCVVL